MTCSSILAATTYTLTGIGPNRLSTSDANLIRRLDNKKFGSPRSRWYGAAIDPNPFHESNVTTMTDMGRHEHRRKKLTPAYNDFEIMERLRCSADNHLGKVLDEHIDRANEDFAEIDLAQVTEHFSIQAFSNMAFGRVGRHGFYSGRTLLTGFLESG